MAIARARRHGLNGRVGRDVMLLVRHGQLNTGRGVRLLPECRIAVVGSREAPAKLVLGDGVSIGDGTRINASMSVAIGAHTEVSWLVQILDTDFHRITETDNTVPPHQAPVIIGSHVLIGTGAIISKGVTIGDGAVIGAGSVVTRDVKPGTLVAGNPARHIRDVQDWV